MTQPNYVVNQPRVLSSTEQDVLRKKLNAITDCKNQLSSKINRELSKPLQKILNMANKICSESLTQNQINCIKNIEYYTGELLMMLNHLVGCYQQNIAPSSSMFSILPMQPSVLLVEDDPLIQKVHRMMLEKMGCIVDVAADGYQAIALANNNYDAILMDIGLPGIDGIEAAVTIRQIQETAKSIPIIALTAYGADITSECLAAGINEVTTKPIKPQELREILEKWLNYEQKS